jgi:selenocysteine lyase/cysteine desulfurase
MLTSESRARDFPHLEGKAYLNTAAEGIPPLVVGEALQQYVNDKQLGMDGRDSHFEQWDAARVLVGEMYDLSVDEVTICSCSSEAFNLAARAAGLEEGDEVVINDLDFPAGSTPWLQDGCPATVKVWRQRDWSLAVEDLVSLLGPRTRVVSTSLVSFFNGFMVPLDEMIEAVHQHSDALVVVDVTQALGRIPLDLSQVDLVISSTHKWILSSHGGGLVGIPSRSADRWKVSAGGWFNLEDAFGSERFEQVVVKPGAAGFTVGMPNFPAIYAIRAGLAYIKDVGVEAICEATRPLVEACLEGLAGLPVELISPRDPSRLAGILAFRHPDAEIVHKKLLDKNIHVMAHAGRLRVAIHGYNTMEDIERLLGTLREALG